MFRGCGRAAGIGNSGIIVEEREDEYNKKN
jgi:hypothetical protein